MDSSALGPTAREEEPHFWQLGGARARCLRARPHPLRRRDRARAAARPARRVVLGRDLRVQGDGRAEGAAALLQRPQRPPHRDRRDARPQPVLDQHVAVVHARPALLRARPQRRDQHDRADALGGAHARRADPRRLLRLAGPEQAGRDPDPQARALAARGDGADGAADRPRDPSVPRGPARLLHVPAAGAGPVRAGADRADRALRRRARVLRRRARPAAAVADRGARHVRLQLRAGRRVGRRHDRRAEAARAGREGAGAHQARSLGAALRPPGDAAPRAPPLARAHRRRAASPASSRRSRPAGRSKARRSPATPPPGRPSR